MKLTFDIDDEKAAVITTLASVDTQILTQALLYARTLVNYGVDISKDIVTATELSQALDRAYAKGRDDERKDRILAMSDRAVRDGVDELFDTDMFRKDRLELRYKY